MKTNVGFWLALLVSVATSPVGAILRMGLATELCVVDSLTSATYTFPALSTAMLAGLQSVAALPAPSWLPQTPGLPARVVTAPAALILRTRWLSVSAT